MENVFLHSIRDQYCKDGVVCLKKAFPAEWIDCLERGLHEIPVEPGPFANIEYDEAGNLSYVSDMFVWTRNINLRSFIFSGGGASIVGELLGALPLRLFFDHAFIRMSGSDHVTHWHNDGASWAAVGKDLCTMWIPTSDVEEGGGSLEYVLGSHRWGQAFKNNVFPMYANPNLDNFSLSKVVLNPIPDIEANRSAFTIKNFSLERGDCLIHHPLVLHHSAPQSNGKGRSAYAIRWAGPNIRYAPRIDTQPLIYDPGLEAGAPLGGDLFPVVLE